MVDIGSLARQVKRNCNISDARYWGNYSLCGLLLRLRDLYRSESRVNPWEKISHRDVGEWISARETLWGELKDSGFGDITLNSHIYDAFEVERINAVLIKEGLVYGAGLGLYGKPSFFLADLVSKEQANGCGVFTAGGEYVRDLADYPAMVQEKTIFVRTDMAKQLLWGRYEEARSNCAKSALTYAFSCYGISAGEEPSENLYARISQVALCEAETYLYHELGEVFEGERIGGEWKALLVSLPHGRAEVFARSVKDILSDTSENGMLMHIIQNRKAGSLGFYLVFLTGLRKIIFPQISEAFQAFQETGDWGKIDEARKAGYENAAGYLENILSLHKRGVINSTLSERIEQKILSGLL
jgi:hypothetical protein